MIVGEMIRPLTPTGFAVAILCGIIIGLERQISGKPAGIRTSSLICLGAYIFVSINGLMHADTDQTRIVAQIITGIGFIGAGVMFAREGIVIGVTSASVIWVLAGIGILIGYARYTLAVFLSLVVVCLLVGVNILEKAIISLQHGVHKKTKKKKHDISEME